MSAKRAVLDRHLQLAGTLGAQARAAPLGSKLVPTTCVGTYKAQLCGAKLLSKQLPIRFTPPSGRSDVTTRSVLTIGLERILALLLVLGLQVAPQAPLLAAADEEDAVHAGAEALDSWWDYPWYDDQQDDVRRINVKAAPQRPVQQTTRPTSASGSLEWLGWTLLAITVIAMLAMLLRAYVNRSREGGRAGAPGLTGSAATVDRLEDLPFQLEQPIDDLLSAARRAAEQRNYERAIIFLYSHLLLELDKQEAIRLTKGKTNRQYLRELRPQPHLVPLLATSMVAFEDVFFGGQPLSQDRFESCWDQAMQLLAVPESKEAA